MPQILSITVKYVSDEIEVFVDIKQINKNK